MLKLVICTRVTCDVPGCARHFDAVVRDGPVDGAARAAGWEAVAVGHPAAPKSLAVDVHRCPACVAAGAGPARWSEAIAAARPRGPAEEGAPAGGAPGATEAAS